MKYKEQIYELTQAIEKKVKADI